VIEAGVALGEIAPDPPPLTAAGKVRKQALKSELEG
jgi:hypothetical protein